MFLYRQQFEQSIVSLLSNATEHVLHFLTTHSKNKSLFNEIIKFNILFLLPDFFKASPSGFKTS